MRNGLYHASIGFPKGFNKPNQTIKLRYGLHAQHAMLNDRYGRIQAPDSLNLQTAQIIEIEIQNNNVCKFVARIPYNNMYDLCLVINLDGFVRTVWLNSKQDTHHTLNTTRYEAA